MQQRGRNEKKKSKERENVKTGYKITLVCAKILKLVESIIFHYTLILNFAQKSCRKQKKKKIKALLKNMHSNIRSSKRSIRKRSASSNVKPKNAK